MRVALGTHRTSAVPEYGGSTWVRLQYLLGLRELGVDVVWVDRLPRVDQSTSHRSLEYYLNRFATLASDFGFGDRYCIVYDEGRDFFGMSRPDLERWLDGTELLVNLGGHLPPGDPLNVVPRRMFVDVDPGFTQMWALQLGWDFSEHTEFVTVGLNLDAPDFAIPSSVRWHPTFTPVVLSQWPYRPGGDLRILSTISDWWGGQRAEYGGEQYDGKRSEYLRLIDLPRRTSAKVEIALSISPWDHVDIARLIEAGWSIVDPYLVAGDPHSYRDFVAFSSAEISVAKQGYVKCRSGWFSDRTAVYLASGRPAIVQSTGFEGKLPTGEGLLTFEDVEEAAAAIQAVHDDYSKHQDAARQIAEMCFSSATVLSRLIDLGA